ncbi:MAG TPA: hypothetical protein VJ501_04655 [Burkholderiaceae bacterium]|nr:hypothetical protein [Burkholderiaceae bacterium]
MSLASTGASVVSRGAKSPMFSLLRAKGLPSYGGKPLALGEEFVVEAKLADALVQLGLATLVKPDVEPPEVPALLKKPRKPPKPKRTYKTRHLTAQ